MTRGGYRPGSGRKPDPLRQVWTHWNLRVPEAVDAVDAEVRASLREGEELSSFIRTAAMKEARRRK
jgi:hypothetical protein